MSDKLILEGKNNRGEPRQKYADKLAGLDDAAFQKDAELHIWLSAYANNNPRSDYHWMAAACHAEADRRGKPELYRQAWEKAARTA